MASSLDESDSEIDTMEAKTTKVKVAIVQAGTIIYDTPATLRKLARLAEDAAAQGAQLVLFPEAFVGGYPKGLDFGVRMGMRSAEGRAEFKKYFDAAIAYDSAEAEFIGEVARKHGIHLVVGVVEKDGSTLYCSTFFYGPNGQKLGRHRKLMPTALERVVWGFGDGSTLTVLDTEIGKMGAAICWENYMPLYRTTLYSKGVEIYLAPTVDDRDTWLSTMRTIAIEGRCFVVSTCQFLTADGYPEGHASHNKTGQVLIRGGACVVDPLGKVLLEPKFNEERVAVVEIDLAEIAGAKFDLDTVGHYARPDVFQLCVNERVQDPVTKINDTNFGSFTANFK
uniref:CN hydrolase domain-containing protein n=1 Tax=Steinernema glaseri TaxID=37863 RepID=A0A1I7YUU5_9BILA